MLFILSTFFSIFLIKYYNPDMTDLVAALFSIGISIIVCSLWFLIKSGSGRGGSGGSGGFGCGGSDSSCGGCGS